MENPKLALQAALKDAMRSKDTFRRDTIRLVQSAIKQVEIDTRKELSPEEVTSIIQKEVKKRRDSVEELEKFGRVESAEKERNEIEILEVFLPQQMNRKEIEALVQEKIQQLGVTSPSDKGKVMGILMPLVKGRADGRLVNEVVQEHLNR